MGSGWTKFRGRWPLIGRFFFLYSRPSEATALLSRGREVDTAKAVFLSFLGLPRIHHSLELVRGGSTIYHRGQLGTPQRRVAEHHGRCSPSMILAITSRFCRTG